VETLDETWDHWMRHCVDRHATIYIYIQFISFHTVYLISHSGDIRRDTLCLLSHQMFHRNIILYVVSSNVSWKYYTRRSEIYLWRRDMKWHKTCTTNLGTSSIIFFFVYLTIIFVYYFFLFVFFFVCGDETWNDTRHAQQISERLV